MNKNFHSTTGSQNWSHNSKQILVWICEKEKASLLSHILNNSPLQAYVMILQGEGCTRPQEVICPATLWFSLLKWRTWICVKRIYFHLFSSRPKSEILLMEIGMEFLAIRITANTSLSTYYMPGTMLDALYMDINNSKQIIVHNGWSES